MLFRQTLVIPEQSGEIETMLNLRPYDQNARAPSDIYYYFYVFVSQKMTTGLNIVAVFQEESSPNEADGDT